MCPDGVNLLQSGWVFSGGLFKIPTSCPVWCLSTSLSKRANLSFYTAACHSMYYGLTSVQSRTSELAAIVSPDASRYTGISVYLWKISKSRAFKTQLWRQRLEKSLRRSKELRHSDETFAALQEKQNAQARCSLCTRNTLIQRPTKIA